MPSLENTRLQSPLPESLIGAHVADLINPMTKQWDLSLLNNLFLSHVVTSIMSIPLGKNRVADKIFWPLNQSGLYTVKSSYQFLMDEQKNSGADGLQFD